jgi:hypothetical protein
MHLLLLLLLLLLSLLLLLRLLLSRDRHHMALERLLRKLLLKPHAPAVVLLQLPSLATLVPGVQAGKEDEEEQEGTEPSTEVSAMQLYASTYDVPYLRLRWGWRELLLSVGSL